MVGKPTGGFDGAGEVFLVRRVRAATERAEVSKGEPRERAEVAIAVEPGEALVLALVGYTFTGEGFAEVGVAEANGLADEACAAAARAGLLVVVERGVRGRCGS
jgi:hypothetical protein